MKKNKVIISTPVHVNLNACDGCGVCVDVCSMNVFEIKEISKETMNDLSFMGKIKVKIKGHQKSNVINAAACIACGKCVSSCHERAIFVKEIKLRA